MALDGKRLVGLARAAIEAKLDGAAMPKTGKSEKRGVFVTLHSHPGRALRGCVGFAFPVFELEEAVVQAALSAAFNDARFLPVKANEMGNLVVEVSVLSKPKLLDCNPESMPQKIRIGKDGLVVERAGGWRGLLLPIVAAEQGLEPEEFLCLCCLKAGLPPDAWQKGAKVSVFQAKVFSEKAPKA